MIIRQVCSGRSRRARRWTARLVMVLGVLHAGAVLASEEREILYWYDPMYPQHRFDEPGRSPFMDMDLVPRYAEPAADRGTVTIDPAVVQSLGIRLATVTAIRPARSVTATGAVGFDDRAVTIVQSRAAGFVERVTSKAPGDLVPAGAVLAELLVPEWTAAQHEYLAVLELGDPDLVAAARDRLRLAGLSADAIRALQASGRVPELHAVRSPAAGVVDALEVRAGMSLAAGATLARIRGLDRVWVEAAVPEQLAGSVREGAPVRVEVTGRTDDVREGTVTAILPMLADATRTLRVRVELDNPDLALRPGMTAIVRLTAPPGRPMLAIPTEAVIWTGRRTLVMVAEGAGRFRPVEIVTGIEVDDRTVVRRGLAEGQQVVASGQFLLDSEASLLGIGDTGNDAAAGARP